jgi:single-stranded DNA-binding protein
MLGAMSYEISGKLHVLFETEQKTERFRKREFVLELTDSRFPQLVLFQLTGDRCEALDAFSKGDSVRVEFNLRGREWTSPKGDVRYFNSLDVWQIALSADGPAAEEEPPMPEEPPIFSEEPPF